MELVTYVRPDTYTMYIHLLHVYLQHIFFQGKKLHNYEYYSTQTRSLSLSLDINNTLDHFL